MFRSIVEFFGEIYWQRPWKQYEAKLGKRGVKEEEDEKIHSALIRSLALTCDSSSDLLCCLWNYGVRLELIWFHIANFRTSTFSNRGRHEKWRHIFLSGFIS